MLSTVRIGFRLALMVREAHTSVVLRLATLVVSHDSGSRTLMRDEELMLPSTASNVSVVESSRITRSGTSRTLHDARSTAVSFVTLCTQLPGVTRTVPVLFTAVDDDLVNGRLE